MKRLLLLSWVTLCRLNCAVRIRIGTAQRLETTPAAPIARSLALLTRTLAKCIAPASLALVSPIQADIIIDDFNDDVTIVSPEMENVWIETLNVGDLAATRAARIGSLGADPDARLEIAGSILEAQFDHPHPTNLGPTVAAQLYYTFPRSDLTSGNALIVDFKSISGSVAPEFLHILLFTDQPFVFESTLSPIPLGGAFSAVLPFSQFGLRGGGPFPINFTQVEEIDVGLFVARDLTDYSNHSWSAAIDRIRVGTVPEPEGMYWLFFTLLVPFPLSSSKLMRMPNTNIAPGWNPNLTHSQIDDNPMVQQRILLRLGQRLLNR